VLLQIQQWVSPIPVEQILVQLMGISVEHKYFPRTDAQIIFGDGKGERIWMTSEFLGEF
jgi:hypothetical protein